MTCTLHVRSWAISGSPTAQLLLLGVVRFRPLPLQANLQIRLPGSTGDYSDQVSSLEPKLDPEFNGRLFRLRFLQRIPNLIRDPCEQLRDLFERNGIEHPDFLSAAPRNHFNVDSPTRVAW
jgi:hypothetical protein